MKKSNQISSGEMACRSFKKRDKLKTREAIVRACEKVMREEGLTATTITKVAKESGYSRRMVYEYFSDLPTLIMCVLRRMDPWFRYEQDLDELMQSSCSNVERDLVARLLKVYFEIHRNNKFARETNLLEITGTNKSLVEKVFKAREELAEKIFELSKDRFHESDVSIRSVWAILIGGINYLVLHRDNADAPFFGIDIDDDLDLERMIRSLDQVICWTYKNA